MRTMFAAKTSGTMRSRMVANRQLEVVVEVVDAGKRQLDYCTEASANPAARSRHNGPTPTVSIRSHPRLA